MICRGWGLGHRAGWRAGGACWSPACEPQQPASLLDPRGAGERAAHLHHTPVISTCSHHHHIHRGHNHRHHLHQCYHYHGCPAGAQNPSGKTILLTMLLQPTIQYFFSQKRAILLKMGRYFLLHVTAKTIEGLGLIVIFIRFSSSWSRSYGHHRHDHIVIIVIIISSSSS